ncbi:uncharacterized protein [Drosophila bipectinata]|uniref:uncharacterized protein n=1 Tax=Drosophila bipectinata TaxID=42026 RepID=UPI0038B39FF1
MRSLYQIISQLTGSCHRRTQPVRDPDGRLLTDDEAQLQRWRQHFMEISCTEQPSSTQDNFRSIVPSNNLRISPTAPSIREIKDAIRKLKRNKAAGDDGIPAELLQINTQLMAETLHPHFNNIWESERIPTSWKKGIIIKLPKKGDLSDCNNWRGITLLNTSYKINASKTKAMRINNSNTNNITIGDNTIEFVDSFTYLGTIITSNGGVESDVENRLRKTRSAFGRLHRVWRNQQINRKTKLGIFNSCVKSILLYGSETWLTNQRILMKLQAYINKCLRIILGVFWPDRISNEDLWHCTGEVPIQEQIKKRKWKWIGHALRKEPGSKKKNC